jgi:hypothetical protein
MGTEVKIGKKGVRLVDGSGKWDSFSGTHNEYFKNTKCSLQKYKRMKNKKLRAEIDDLQEEIDRLQTKLKNLKLKAIEDKDEKNDTIEVGDSVILCGGTRGDAGTVVVVHEITKFSVWVLDGEGKCFLKRKHNIRKCTSINK